MDTGSNVSHVVIVCGDRNWQAPGPIHQLIESLPDRTIIITGGAAGADTLAWDFAKRVGLRTLRIDAGWEYYGKRAGPVRNQWMLDTMLMWKFAYPNVVCEVHAFHEHIATSKGTADMVSRARNAQIPYTIHSDADVTSPHATQQHPD